MKFFSLEDGKKIVKLARHSVELYFEGKDLKNNEFEDKKGVFVTICSWPSGKLRGCIGYIIPDFSLSKAVVNAARVAAFSDPRFIPLDKKEKVVFEVNILTKPDLIKEDYLEEIKIGRDGLIVSLDGDTGLLLPSVAVEYKWGNKEFLEHTCLKAGLDKESWKDKSCKVYRFRSQIFKEVEPDGEIIEVNFNK